jgi:hypothetical protein
VDIVDVVDIVDSHPQGERLAVVEVLVVPVLWFALSH